MCVIEKIIIKINFLVLVFDVSSDSDDNDENVIAVIPRANQIENEDFNSNY